MIGILLVSTLFALPTPGGTLDVFAAASLRDSFTELAQQYEERYPNVDVRLNFAGSQALAAQIAHGARADVFASAATKNLEDIEYDKSSYRVFARNKLQIAVRSGLTGISSYTDLANVPMIVVADPAVPVGMYTESFFTKAASKNGSEWIARVRSHIVSREVDVKAVLAKVRLGEADAGIVYASDIVAAGDAVRAVDIPGELNQTAEYPVAVPVNAKNKREAMRFIMFLMEPGSQSVFEKAGFLGSR